MQPEGGPGEVDVVGGAALTFDVRAQGSDQQSEEEGGESGELYIRLKSWAPRQGLGLLAREIKSATLWYCGTPRPLEMGSRIYELTMPFSCRRWCDQGLETENPLISALLCFFNLLCWSSLRSSKIL